MPRFAVELAASNQQIIIYVHSGPWWVQPWARLTSDRDGDRWCRART